MPTRLTKRKDFAHKVAEGYFPLMSLADVEEIALKLSETDRAHLAAILLESVAADSLDHGADELERREREMDQGQVSEISHEKLLK